MLQTAIPYAAHATLKVGGSHVTPPRSLATNDRGKGLGNHIHKHARPARRQLSLLARFFRQVAMLQVLARAECLAPAQSTSGRVV